jgi:hypothetical protein
MVVRLGPLAQTLSGCLEERVCVLPHEGKRRESHGLPFSLEMQATIIPRNDGTSHFVERMGIFGQHTLNLGPCQASIWGKNIDNLPEPTSPRQACLHQPCDWHRSPLGTCLKTPIRVHCITLGLVQLWTMWWLMRQSFLSFS